MQHPAYPTRFQLRIETREDQIVSDALTDTYRLRDVLSVCRGLLDGIDWPDEAIQGHTKASVLDMLDCDFAPRSDAEIERLVRESVRGTIDPETEDGCVIYHLRVAE